MPSVELTLSFEGPVLSAGLGTRRVGIDMEMRRDGFDRHVIAGSHIQGRLREALEELLVAIKQPNPVEVRSAREAAAQIFGREARGSEPNLRSLVRVGDLVLVDDTSEAAGGLRAQPQGDGRTSEPGFRTLAEADYRNPLLSRRVSSTSTRIAIDGRTGTARRAALAFIEAERVGPRRSYRGTVQIPHRLTGLFNAEELVQLLGWCLRWLRHVGKQNTAGWGAITDRLVNGAPPKTDSNLRVLLETLWNKGAGGPPPAMEAIPDRPAARIDGDEAVIGFAAVVHGPILIADGTPGSNVFEGRTDIPGAVIRRALADVLLEKVGRRRGGWIDDRVAADLTGDDRELALGFADVRVSFALPIEAGAPETKQMLPWPLTSYWQPEENLNDPPPGDTLATLARRGGDVSAAATDLLLHCGGEPPVLISREAARRQEDVARTLQIHVAKSRRTGAAQDGQLFATRAIAPLAFQRTPDGAPFGKPEHARFAGTIRCPSSISDAVKNALAQIERLGKATGRGYGEVRLFEVPMPLDEWRARLDEWNERCPPGVADAVDVPITLATDALLLDGKMLAVHADLRAPYTSAWRDVLLASGLDEGVAIEVPVMVAAHRMWGGATAMGSGAVPPALVTLAGSTFLIRLAQTTREQVAPVLKRLLRSGAERLSLLRDLDARWGRRAPLGGDNGYGQVCIVHEQHLKGL